MMRRSHGARDQQTLGQSHSRMPFSPCIIYLIFYLAFYLVKPIYESSNFQEWHSESKISQPTLCSEHEIQVPWDLAPEKLYLQGTRPFDKLLQLESLWGEGKMLLVW